MVNTDICTNINNSLSYFYEYMYYDRREPQDVKKDRSFYKQLAQVTIKTKETPSPD